MALFKKGKSMKLFIKGISKYHFFAIKLHVLIKTCFLLKLTFIRVFKTIFTQKEMKTAILQGSRTPSIEG